MPCRLLTFFTFSGGRLRTLLGWTPGLRTLVRGRMLACGCLAGVYETCASELAEVIDAAGPECTIRSHREHTVLWRRPAQALPPFESGTEVPQTLQ